MSPARRPNAQLIAEAVIANYIHDISVNHSHRGSSVRHDRAFREG
jgi:hypothetical protein